MQDEIGIIPGKLALTLGSKFENNSFSGLEIQPSTRLAWSRTSRQTIWGAVSRAVRTPSHIEEGFHYTALIQPAIPLYVRIIGDGQFTPEQMTGYELGYRFQVRKSAVLGFAGFHNRYDDLLENRAPGPENIPPPTRLVLPLYLRNGIHGMTSGGEIVGIWDIVKALRLQGSWSFLALDAKRNPGSNDASSVRQLEGDSPAHKVILNSAFTLPKKFEADLTWRYVSSVPAHLTPRLTFESAAASDSSLISHSSAETCYRPFHYEYGGNPGTLVGIRRCAYLKLTWAR